jgi:phage terminase small subunit
MALNPKQQRFVAEYLKDLNATQAAIRAGYSEKTAPQIASRLLTNVKVASAVAEGQQVIAEKAGVTVEKVVNELASIGFANFGDYLNAEGRISLPLGDRAKMAAVGEYTTEAIGDQVITRTKFKLLDKRAALVDLGKHLGMFAEKAERKLTLDIVTDSTPLELARGLAFVLALAQREAGASTAAPAAPPIKH